MLTPYADKYWLMKKIFVAGKEVESDIIRVYINCCVTGVYYCVVLTCYWYSSADNLLLFIPKLIDLLLMMTIIVAVKTCVVFDDDPLMMTVLIQIPRHSKLMMMLLMWWYLMMTLSDDGNHSIIAVDYYWWPFDEVMMCLMMLLLVLCWWLQYDGIDLVDVPQWWLLTIDGRCLPAIRYGSDDPDDIYYNDIRQAWYSQYLVLMSPLLILRLMTCWYPDWWHSMMMIVMMSYYSGSIDDDDVCWRHLLRDVIVLTGDYYRNILSPHLPHYWFGIPVVQLLMTIDIPKPVVMILMILAILVRDVIMTNDIVGNHARNQIY